MDKKYVSPALAEAEYTPDCLLTGSDNVTDGSLVYIETLYDEFI